MGHTVFGHDVAVRIMKSQKQELSTSGLCKALPIIISHEWRRFLILPGELLAVGG